jgi:hypothetical protein
MRLVLHDVFVSSYVTLNLFQGLRVLTLMEVVSRRRGKSKTLKQVRLTGKGLTERAQSQAEKKNWRNHFPTKFHIG